MAIFILENTRAIFIHMTVFNYVLCIVLKSHSIQWFSPFIRIFNTCHRSPFGCNRAQPSIVYVFASGVDMNWP